MKCITHTSVTGELLYYCKQLSIFKEVQLAQTQHHGAKLHKRVVGVIATNLSVAPSFHWEVIVVFFYGSGVFAACVRAAGRVTSCLVMLNVLRKC